MHARDNNTLATVRRGEQLTFNEWADFFVENYSKPPIRAEKTHEVSDNALNTLRPVFGPMKLVEIDATGIEVHLRNRLKQRRHVRRKSGAIELGLLKPATVHQEFRGQPVCRCRVPRNFEGTVPATLRDGVGAADD